MNHIVFKVGDDEVREFSYSYDALGRPVSRNDDDFAYNARSEVSEATIGGVDAEYVYDPAGNRTYVDCDGDATTYTANGLNQYGAVVSDGVTNAMEYDDWGSLTRAGTSTYRYFDGLLTRARAKDAQGVYHSATFENDAEKRRRCKHVPSGFFQPGDHYFTYSGWSLQVEDVFTGSNYSSPSATIRFIWGKDLSGTIDGAGGVGGLLATEVGGVWYFPLYDSNGNVTDYVSETGEVVASYEYDAFGRTIAQSGAMADVFPFRFSTKYYDAESGLYYYGYRYYSPELGRWLTRDPIEEDRGDNLYAMCHNNTIMFVDADGRKLYEWNAETARELLVKTIDDFRKRGWDFAADALSHFLNGTRNNIDLSRYSNDISSNSSWRQFFLNNVSSKLNMGDKDKKIGDIDHEVNFSKDLSSVNFTSGVFNVQFDYRFHWLNSRNLFYALYGSRYSYVGTASKSKTKIDGNCCTMLDFCLTLSSWDALTYPSKGGRGFFPEYSAATYLETLRRGQDRDRYFMPYVYLLWNESGQWVQCTEKYRGGVKTTPWKRR